MASCSNSSAIPSAAASIEVIQGSARIVSSQAVRSLRSMQRCPLDFRRAQSRLDSPRDRDGKLFHERNRIVAIAIPSRSPDVSAGDGIGATDRHAHSEAILPDCSAQVVASVPRCCDFDPMKPPQCACDLVLELLSATGALAGAVEGKERDPSAVQGQS